MPTSHIALHAAVPQLTSCCCERSCHQLPPKSLRSPRKTSTAVGRSSVHTHISSKRSRLSQSHHAAAAVPDAARVAAWCWHLRVPWPSAQVPMLAPPTNLPYLSLPPTALLRSMTPALLASGHSACSRPECHQLRAAAAMACDSALLHSCQQPLQGPTATTLPEAPLLRNSASLPTQNGINGPPPDRLQATGCHLPLSSTTLGMLGMLQPQRQQGPLITGRRSLNAQHSSTCFKESMFLLLYPALHKTA
jgi:hypothetical protein